MVHQTLLVILRCLTLLCVLSLAVAAGNNSVVSDQIRLDCGASVLTSLDSDNRTWENDNGSKFAPSVKGIAIPASYQDSALLPTVPYMTARIFILNYTYSFPVRPGRVFVRLYFNPNTYGKYTPANSYFGVRAGNLTLLDNFNASQYALATNVSFFLEYSINVTSGMLDLTFTPSTHQNNSYAFINGIEIVPTPDLFTTPIPTLANGGDPHPFPIDPAWGFQTMHRLNVGGQSISPHDDVDFYRSWDDDTPYLFGAAYGVVFGKDNNVTIEYTPIVPNYTAPVNVYATARSMGTNARLNLNYNLTWILPVDAGAYYLLRFHFCEIQYPVTKANQRVFFIDINNQTALEMDIIARSNGIGQTVYMDFVVLTTGFGHVDLWVALHPDFWGQPMYYDAILNGLEIFKIQNIAENSFAMLKTPLPPSPNLEPNGTSGKRKPKHAAPAIIGGGVGSFVALVIACIAMCIMCRQKKKAAMELASTDKKIVCNRLPSGLCQHFTFQEIQAATGNFDETFLLGKGGFGSVYCGTTYSGIKVAIKRGNPLSQQGLHEFRTEIETLSLLRHRHLVSLIGYCEENNEMILVYDHMANGTLREHLYNSKNSPLAWKQRLDICIGAAQGLHYLHAGAKQTIIHRDVKTANILLDDKFIAKVSDFGLSKSILDIEDTYVSTVVKGTFGYLDPEYFRRKQLTQKSDVYSFGVLLFEVLCARPVVNIELPDEQVSLRDWALSCQNKGALNEIIDPHLQGEITPECFRMFVETAERCVAERSIDRPLMGDVLQSLQLALQLQESRRDNRSYVDTNPSPDTTMSIAGQGAVYSDIAHTEGR